MRGLAWSAFIQAFWQGVWNELGINVTVPPMPALSVARRASLERFGLLPMYLPAIERDDFPQGFIKISWWGKPAPYGKDVCIPLVGQWIAIETIAKPCHHLKPSEAMVDYLNDRLMAAVRRTEAYVKHDDRFPEGGLGVICARRNSRFCATREELEEDLLGRIAHAIGFPEGTRLPSAEEWNLAGNLFNWLRVHRQMGLPDLGSTRTCEHVRNYMAPYEHVLGDRAPRDGLQIGGMRDAEHRGELRDDVAHPTFPKVEGLSHVQNRGCAEGDINAAFRVLVAL